MKFKNDSVLSRLSRSAVSAWPASSEAQGLLEPKHLIEMSSDLLAIIRIAWLEHASKDLSRGTLGYETQRVRKRRSKSLNAT